MKEIISISWNTAYVLDEDTGKFIDQFELVLICSEPEYTPNVTGFTKNSRISDTRLTITGKQALKKLGEKLMLIADDSKVECLRFEKSPD